MMNFLKEKREAGFTLVELLVVIAIIGILSAVAVPNFKKFKERAKMSEADVNMSTMYTGLIAYELDSDTYATATLSNIGYSTSTKNKFTIGYGTTLNTDCDAEGSTTGSAGYTCTDNTVAAATSSSFTVEARGDIENNVCQILLDHNKQRTLNSVAGGNDSTCR